MLIATSTACGKLKFNKEIITNERKSTYAYQSTDLSLYCELKISKSELQQAIGEDLHNVECKKAYCIKRSDVVNAIQLYKNGAISKDALVE